MDIDEIEKTIEESNLTENDDSTVFSKPILTADDNNSKQFFKTNF